MQQIILADNQVIFRTGVARVLSQEFDLRVVAQCANITSLKEAIGNFPRSIVLFPSSMGAEISEILGWIEKAESKAVIILEHGAVIDDELALRAQGIVLRSVGAPQLVGALRRVMAGERIAQQAIAKPPPSQDRVGARILARLTPKEVQMIALVAEGCKNKEIAARLATKEQVVKNYLRITYDKIGVSDRLELTVFIVNHRALAEAVEQARALLSQTT